MKLASAIALSALLVSHEVAAATKYLTCSVSGKDGSMVLKATIADESDQAEVLFYSPTAACMPSCEPDVYRKVVLPSVIRLHYGLTEGGVELTHTIDVNRTTLAVTADTVITILAAKAAGMEKSGTSSSFAGTCTVRVDETKKLL